MRHRGRPGSPGGEHAPHVAGIGKHAEHLAQRTAIQSGALAHVEGVHDDLYVRRVEEVVHELEALTRTERPDVADEPAKSLQHWKAPVVLVRIPADRYHDLADHRGARPTAQRRVERLNALSRGKLPEPLARLRQHRAVDHDDTAARHALQETTVQDLRDVVSIGHEDADDIGGAPEPDQVADGRGTQRDKRSQDLRSASPDRQRPACLHDPGRNRAPKVAETHEPDP